MVRGRYKEIVEGAVKIIDKIGANVNIQFVDHFDQTSKEINKIVDNHSVIFAPDIRDVNQGHQENIYLFKRLELFANCIQIKTLKPDKRNKNFDILLIRENLEGEYC